MYVNLLLVTFLFISSLSSITPCPLSFDGTYAFTVLNEEFNINICTNDAGESYMSINAINTLNLANANYVLGAFRDLDGAQEIKCDVFILIFEGFQMVPPPKNEFEAMKYKFTVDKRNPYQHKYILSRDMEHEIFVLEKISSIPLTYCFEPGDIPSTQYPVMYQSIDLIGSGLCRTITDSCYDVRIVNHAAPLTDVCWVNVDDKHIPIRGGVNTAISIEWSGSLSLYSGIDESVSTGGLCRTGALMVVTDPKDPNKIITSLRCIEGHLGYIWESTLISIDNKMCPLYTSISQ